MLYIINALGPFSLSESEGEGEEALMGALYLLNAYLIEMKLYTFIHHQSKTKLTSYAFVFTHLINITFHFLMRIVICVLEKYPLLNHNFAFAFVYGPSDSRYSFGGPKKVHVDLSSFDIWQINVK